MINATLFADSARGVYIPQHFAESAQRDKFTGIDSEQWGILESGPDNDLYCDVWDEVLDNAETTCGGVLHQDGDLWIIWADKAIEAVNAESEWRLEYETSHEDAGDAYAHMPAESWTSEDDKRLAGQLSEAGDVNPCWRDVEPDKLSSIALDCFSMQTGSIYGPHDGGIVLGAYPVQEIEFELDHIADGVTLDYIRESCECYISGCNRAYVTTDSVWYAVLDMDQFNAAISEHLT